MQQPEDGRTESDVSQFTAALSQACIALKQYGKSPAELRAMRDMFLAVLADIPVKDLTKALFVHLNVSDEIPTPKQLRNVIFPPQEPLSATVYIELKNKIHEGYFPLSYERDFMRAFEAQEIGKVRGGSESSREANMKIANHSSKNYNLGYEGDGYGD